MPKSHRSLKRKDVQDYFLDAAYRPSTREERMRILDQFAEWIEVRAGLSWTAIDWGRMSELVDVHGHHLAWEPITEELLAEFIGRGEPKDNTRGLRILTLKMYFAYVVAQGILSDNPLENVTYPKRHRPEPLALTVEELEAVVVGAQAGPDGLRNHALVAIYAWGAYRRSEPVSLSVEDLDFAENTLHLLYTKTRRSERRLFPEPVHEVIRRWLSSPRRAESPWLFPGDDPRDHLRVRNGITLPIG